MAGSVGIAVLEQGAGVANYCCFAGTMRLVKHKIAVKMRPRGSLGARLSASFATAGARSGFTVQYPKDQISKGGE
jgi:hypothetical protein